MGMKFSLSDETKTADLADVNIINDVQINRVLNFNTLFLFYRKFAFSIE